MNDTESERITALRRLRVRNTFVEGERPGLSDPRREILADVLREEQFSELKVDAKRRARQEEHLRA